MSEENFISFLNYCFIVLPVLACIFIITVSFTFKTYRKPIGRMILFLTLANFFTSVPFLSLFQSNFSIFGCKLYYLIYYYCQSSTFLWVWCISYCLVKIFLLPTSSESRPAFSFRKAALISLLGPLPTMLLVLFTDYVYVDQGVCSVDKNDDSSTGMILIFVPVLLTVIFTVASYIIIFVQLGKYGSEYRQLIRVNWMSLFAYSLVLVICWLPLLFLMLFVDPEDIALPVLLIILKFPQLQSVFNAIIFGCSPSTRIGIKKKWCGIDTIDSTVDETTHGESLDLQDEPEDQDQIEEEERRAASIADTYYRYAAPSENKLSLVSRNL